MNSLRNLLGQTSPFFNLLNNIGSWIGLFQQFARNPIAAIMSRTGVKVPKDFNGTPEQLARHLMSTGQMTQEQFQQCAQGADQIKDVLPKF